MFEEFKNLVRDAVKAVRQRIEPIEADVKEIRSDIADLKAFRDELKAEVALLGKGEWCADFANGALAKTAGSAPQPEHVEDHAPEAPEPALAI